MSKALWVDYLGVAIPRGVVIRRRSRYAEKIGRPN